jgi:hypothetical protein
MNDSDEDISVPVLGITKTLGSSLLGPNARSLYEDQLDRKMISEIIADYSELLQALRMSLDGDKNVIFGSKIYSLEYILWRAEQGNYSSLRVVATLLFLKTIFLTDGLRALRFLQDWRRLIIIWQSMIFSYVVSR